MAYGCFYLAENITRSNGTKIKLGQFLIRYKGNNFSNHWKKTEVSWHFKPWNHNKTPVIKVFCKGKNYGLYYTGNYTRQRQYSFL